MDKKTAVEKWVEGLNSIPLSLIERAYGDDCTRDIKELTRPSYECTECGELFSEKEAKQMDFQCTCRIPLSFSEWCEEHPTVGERILNSREIELLEYEYDDYCSDHFYPEMTKVVVPNFYPERGYVWTFGNSFDNEWLENNLDKVTDCGFRIYQSSEIGYFLGLDGGGYNSIDAHWLPLYDARGMAWHKED